MGFKIEVKEKGINGTINYLRYLFRLKTSVKEDRIDEKRIQNNLYFNLKINKWIKFSKNYLNLKKDIKNLEDKFIEKLNIDLYNQVNLLNRKYPKNEKYFSVKDYLKDKSLSEEITLTDQREWLAISSKNKVIKLNGKSSFEIIDEEKLMAWANVGIKFWKDKIEKDFGKDVILACVLHLDESSPHIHIVFNKQRLKYHKKYNRMNYSFSKEGTFIRPSSILSRKDLKTYYSNLSKEYWNYQQQELKEKFGWDKNINKDDFKDNISRKYLPLNEYKIITNFREEIFLEKNYPGWRKKTINQKEKLIKLLKESKDIKPIINEILKQLRNSYVNKDEKLKSQCKIKLLEYYTEEELDYEIGKIKEEIEVDRVWER